MPAMGRRLAKSVSSVSLCLGTVLLLFLSSYLQHHYVIGWSKPIEVPSLQNSLYFVLFACLCFLKRKWQPWVCGALILLTQTVGFIDACYYRFFRDLPSLHLLPTWFQAGQIGDSITSGLSKSDAFLLLPVVGFALLLLLVRRFAGEAEPSPKLAMGLLLLSLGVSAWSVHELHPVRYEQMQRRFQNKAVENLFGPHFYHIYDLVEWSRIKLGAESSVAFDESLIQEVIEKSRELALSPTPMMGRYEGRDFIFIQLESLESFALKATHEDRPVMPFLREAWDRVSHFDLFDQTHLGRSADGQFIYLNSLHPPASRPLPFVYPGNEFYALPSLFTEEDYHSIYLEPVDGSFWNSKYIAVSYGFQEIHFKEDLPPKNRKKDIRGWGLTDRALFDKIEEFQTDVPYFMYVVTLMCHHPYSEKSNVPVDFPPKKKLSMVRRYLRCAAVRDNSVKQFMLKLSKTERGRKTVICLAGDHDANLPKAEMKKLGYPLFPERERVPVLLGSVEEFLGLPSAEKVPPQVRDFGGQMDLAPTLAHVFSLNMEESVFVGWNLFATQNRGPHHSRVGTWMDQSGKIRQVENSQDSAKDRLFKVSEMLLQGNKIGAFRSKDTGAK